MNDDLGSQEGLAEISAAPSVWDEEPSAGSSAGPDAGPSAADDAPTAPLPAVEQSQQPAAAESQQPTAAESQPSAAAESPRRQQDRHRSAWRELPILIVVALAIALVIKSFVVQPFFIPSSSMENTLMIGDKVLVNKLVYHVRSIDRGDIIVFNGTGSWNAAAPASGSSRNPIVRAYDVTLGPLFRSLAGLFGTPADTGTDYIKRVVGLPGDHVACCTRGLVTVNGVPLHEGSYVHPGEAPSLMRFSVTVPPGRLWVMGDNRQVSDDSRLRQYDPGRGTIPEKEVIGRAFVVVWPPSRWRTLPIPSTFDRPALVKSAAAALPYAPLVAGVGAAVPLTWLQRRVRSRMRNRPQRCRCS